MRGSYIDIMLCWNYIIYDRLVYDNAHISLNQELCHKSVDMLSVKYKIELIVPCMRLFPIGPEYVMKHISWLWFIPQHIV